MNVVTICYPDCKTIDRFTRTQDIDSFSILGKTPILNIVSSALSNNFMALIARICGNFDPSDSAGDRCFSANMSTVFLLPGPNEPL